MVLETIRAIVGPVPEGFEVYEYLFSFILSMFAIKYLLQLFKIPLLFMPRLK